MRWPIGQYGSNPLAVDIFAVNLLLAAVATQATLLYGRRRDALTVPGAAEVRARRARLTVMVIAVTASIGLAWVNTSAAKCRRPRGAHSGQPGTIVLPHRC